jgi:ABC-type uncharacterized transport system ATPase subunit
VQLRLTYQTVFGTLFLDLTNADEINLAKNAARKAWAKVCVRKASEIASNITKSQCTVR